MNVQVIGGSQEIEGSIVTVGLIIDGSIGYFRFDGTRLKEIVGPEKEPWPDAVARGYKSGSFLIEKVL